MIHVLFFTPAYPPFPGGGERYVQSLAIALRQRQTAVTILTSHATQLEHFWTGTPQQKPTVSQEEGLTIHRLPLAPFWGGRQALFGWRRLMVLLGLVGGERAAGLLRRMARRFPTVVGLAETAVYLPQTITHVHGFNLSWEFPLLAAADFARQRQLPFFVTPFAHLGVHKADSAARNSTMPHQRKLLCEATALLTLSSTVGEGLAQHGVVPPRLAVIGSGVDAPVAEAVSLLKEIEPPYFLFLGRASRDKGAIDAAKATLRLGGGQTLLLAGPMGADFASFYARLDEEEKTAVRHLGFVSEAEKQTLLANCTALLLPSRMDSLGIVLLEAWTHGKPVIGARAGGIPGIIAAGEDGLLVPFGDVAALAEAMRRLQQSAALREQLGAAGRRKVQTEYQWPQVADRVLAAYGE